MASSSRYGSTKRFGPRYGRKIKEKVGKIEAAKHASTLCPYCRSNHAKRIAAGIWTCTKCRSTFTGRAYTIGRAPEAREQVTEADEPQEPEEDEETPSEEKAAEAA